MPKYHFEEATSELGRQLPGARLVSSIRSGDFTSPVSWFRPTTTTWNFAMPDPRMDGRFYTFTMVFGEKEPFVFLLDVDCQDRTLIWYSLSEPASAFPARDIFGEPVVTPNGKTYRRFDAKYPAPPEWMPAFCDTDWTAEKDAARVSDSLVRKQK
jgi:hypothetical protein